MPRPVEEAGRTAGSADLIASLLLLGVTFLLGLVGATAIWFEAGSFTESSGPSVPAMCAFEQVVVVAVPAVSLVIFVCGTVSVADRRLRHLSASPSAAIAVASVALTCVLAGWIAYAGAATMCLS